MIQFSQKIFISLPVSDLQKSVSFYRAIEFNQNEGFPDKETAWMVLSENFSVMLMTHDKWKEFFLSLGLSC